MDRNNDHQGKIHAEVHVEGDVSGQLAIGNNIVQLKVDTLHGDLVTLLPRGARLNPTPRSGQIRLIPRRPDPMFDRRDETGLVLSEANAGRPVAVHGPRGIGTSTLLRHLATFEPFATACGGVAFLSASGLGR